MNDEQNPNEAPIGLYRDPESGQFIGATEPAQAAAYTRIGFKLYEAGREAASKTQEELDKLTPAPSRDLPPGGATYEPTVKKGGK